MALKFPWDDDAAHEVVRSHTRLDGTVATLERSSPRYYRVCVKDADGRHLMPPSPGMPGSIPMLMFLHVAIEPVMFDSVLREQLVELLDRVRGLRGPRRVSLLEAIRDGRVTHVIAALRAISHWKGAEALKPLEQQLTDLRHTLVTELGAQFDYVVPPRRRRHDEAPRMTGGEGA